MALAKVQDRSEKPNKVCLVNLFKLVIVVTVKVQGSLFRILVSPAMVKVEKGKTENLQLLFQQV